MASSENSRDERATIRLRDALPDDLPQIRAIYSHYVATSCCTFELEAPHEAAMLERYRSIVYAGLPYLVAEAHGEVIGYAYAGAYRERPAYRFTVEDSIYLSANHHGRGVGKLLLEELLKRCQAGPWKQMVAVIGDKENAASIGLHARCGFRHAGTLERVGFKFGRWVDTVMMQRALEP